MKLDPVQAFAFAFCDVQQAEILAYTFKPGEELYERWRPTVTWGLDYARALIGKGRPIAPETAQAMAARPLVDGVYPPGHLDRFERATRAMIEAARQAHAREQGAAA